MVQGFSTEPGTQGPLADIPEAGVRKVRRWGMAIALGGFLFGFDTGVVSGALLFFKHEFGLSAFQQSSVVSILLIGAMIGALSAGRVADRLGRRRTMVLEGLVFIVGTVIAMTATGYGMLMLARIVLGIGVGAASATVPVYLSEISPAEIRGRILAMNQLMITIGILVAYIVNMSFSSSENWRAMFGFGLLPAGAMILCALFFLPESPQWMLTHNQVDRARKLMSSVTDVDRANRMIALVGQMKKKEDSESESGHARQGWRVLLAAPVRPALIVGLTLAAVQQLGGINTIIYYAPTIIERTGLTASNSIFYSVFIGIINLAMTVVAIRLIDRIGRRVLLLGSLSAMTVTLAMLGTTFVLEMNSMLSLICMVLYIAAFACGLGPVFWVLVGELFPPSAKAVGSSVSTTVNWLANFVVGLLFLPVVNAIGQGETFWIFAAICAFGLFFVARYVPETKGRDFNEVNATLWSRFHRRAGTSTGPHNQG